MSINVKNSPYNAVGNGVVDDSAAILAAVTAAGGSQKVLFPPGFYKFSITIDESLVTTFEGEGKDASWCTPLSPSQPCFILNQTSHFPTFLKSSFRDLGFYDPSSQTSCAIWNAAGAVDIDRCQFLNLKYGIINNVSEWSRYDRSYFAGCQFGVYSTSSNAANDPLGFSSGSVARFGGANPSEQYFRDCWFNFCNTAYYEDQPTNPWDLSCHVLFDSCQLMGGNSVIVSIGVQQGEITLNKCWFEGRTGNEPGVAVHGKSIPSSIIYTEGASVVMREAKGIIWQHPIFVKFSPGFNSAISLPPRLVFENTDFQLDANITLDEGVVSTIDGGQMNGVDLTFASSVRNVTPCRPTDSPSSKCVTWPASVWPITLLQRGPFHNLWPNGDCSVSPPSLYGVPTSAVITVGDGFVGNKYLKVVGMPNGLGVNLGSFTTITNKIYFMSFGIRQSSGSTKGFLVTGHGYNPGQAGWVNVKSGGWRFFCSIIGCNTGAVGGDIRILNENGSPVDFDLSAIQLVQFDTIEQAMIYSNSGIYTLP